MKRKILGLVAVGLLFGAMPSRAVNLAPGESWIWNFDLTGVPIAGATAVQFGGGGTVGLELSIYGGLNGTQFVRAGSTPVYYLGLTDPELLDGIFSLVVRNTFSFVGNFNFENAQYYNGETYYTGDPAAPVSNGPFSAVPEPGTLALLGLGLAGLGLSRRRKSH